jgi:hypothetical protein
LVRCFGTVGYGSGVMPGLNGEMGLVVGGSWQDGVGEVHPVAPRPEPSMFGDGSHTLGSGLKSGPDPAGMGGGLEGSVPPHHGTSRFNTGISGKATGTTNGCRTGTGVVKMGVAGPGGPWDVGMLGGYVTGRKRDGCGCVAGVWYGGGTTGSTAKSFSSSSSYHSPSCSMRRGNFAVALLFLCLWD